MEDHVVVQPGARIPVNARILRAIRLHKPAQALEPLFGRSGAHAIQQLVQVHERERERRFAHVPLPNLRAPREISAQLPVVHGLVRGEIMLECAVVGKIVFVVRRQFRLADEQPIARFKERRVLALEFAQLLQKRRQVAGHRSRFLCTQFVQREQRPLPGWRAPIGHGGGRRTPAGSDGQSGRPAFVRIVHAERTISPVTTVSPCVRVQAAPCPLRTFEVRTVRHKTTPGSVLRRGRLVYVRFPRTLGPLSMLLSVTQELRAGLDDGFVLVERLLIRTLLVAVDFTGREETGVERFVFAALAAACARSTSRLRPLFCHDTLHKLLRTHAHRGSCLFVRHARHLPPACRTSTLPTRTRLLIQIPSRLLPEISFAPSPTPILRRALFVQASIIDELVAL